MRRRLLKIIVPITALTVAVGCIVCLALHHIERNYQLASNQEFTAILGAAITASDDDGIIANLRHPETAQIAAGKELLAQYGYLPEDYLSPSAEQIFRQVLVLILITLLVIAIAFLLYFCWLDWYRSRQITRLVAYMQNLSERMYDLHLDENSEDELSILSNELYKLMVLLREAADNNHRARQQLETALADISHQLRTPLTSMQVMVDNIYDDPKMPLAVRQDFLRSISRQVESMSSLVMTLLNLAKFDNGSIRLQQLPVEAGELLDEVRQKLEILADLRGVEIVFAGDLQAQVRVDRRWQVEALTNIVKNCLEHSPEGSKVTITVASSPLFLRFKIQDQGEGIAAKDLRHIFERFYRAKNSAAGSIGIGLAFAKTIVEADNGQISVKSQEGKGTEFDVTYFRQNHYS